MNTSHRPHNPGNDYFDAGIYHITLVVRDREALLGRLGSDARRPEVVLSPLGQAVMEYWHSIPEHHAEKGRSIRIHAACVMPDHFHGVIEVMERMDRSLGEVIRSFKTACTRAWRELQGQPVSPNLAIQEHLQHLSAKKRSVFYESKEGRPLRPLFDDNYDDTICLRNDDDDDNDDCHPEGEAKAKAKATYSQRHLEAMIHYVEDNPRRAIMRQLFPDFMRRCLHVRIGEHEYAAFGNLFLLRWGDRRQVFFHRRAQKGQRDEAGQFYPFDTPYETTVQYRKESEALLAAAREGRAVLVTPGISKGEQMVKNTAISEHLPLIHLQKEPMSKYWKPERSRFEACEAGALLILAPWHLDEMEYQGFSNTDYAHFHNMNELAAEICEWFGEAKILKLA